MVKPHNEQTIISWKAPEFIHYKKNQWWFPTLALVTVALTTIALLTHQYVLAVIVVLSGWIIYQLAHTEPEVVAVIFSTAGIKFRDRTYSFDRLRSFWISEINDHKRLHLQPVERFSFPVVIPLVAQDVAKVRDFLSHYLPENHEIGEDLADRINRLLRI